MRIPIRCITHGEGHFLHGVAFVEVKASCMARLSRPTFANHQSPGVAMHCADGKVRNLLIGDDIGVFNLLGEGSQPAAQDHANCWLLACALADGVGGFVVLFQ